MSKADRVTALLKENADGLDPHYAGWFACFNEGAYYEAHDVLEALWLPQRRQPDDRFYKGLIQLAGAFVHLQKNRLKPAEALFQLAEANLRLYGDQHHRLKLPPVLDLIRQWRQDLAAGAWTINPLETRPAPRVTPEPRDSGPAGSGP